MSTPVLKAVLAAAGFTLSSLALAAATLVQDVRVFDGKAVHEKRSVLFDGAVILDADFRGTPPVGARIVIGAGRTLLPGLIDAHTHAFKQFDLPLLFGVTTQIDMFTAVPLMQEVKRSMAARQNAGRADLFSAGTLATAPNGHGTQFGVPIPTLRSPAQARDFVDARIAEGSDFIKIVLEAGGHGTSKMNSLDLATAKALIEAAHLRGKLAVVHVSNEADARAALEAGADGLVHLFLGAAPNQQAVGSLAQLAKRKGAFVIPTFTVLESMAGVKGGDDVLGDAGLAALVDREGAATLKSRYGAQPRPSELAMPKAVTAALAKAGVPVLAGTDSGNAGTLYGISMHRELAAVVEAGLSPQAALVAATSAPAAAFKLGQRGCVAKGCKADLLLVEGNPAADIKATRRIVEVWKDGQSANALRDKKRQQVAAESSSAKRQALPPGGRIGDFSNGLLSPFGSGWMPSTDQFAGGKSTVKLEVLPPLPDGLVPLAVNATVAPGLPFAWSSVAFMPGATPMEPVDLSAAKVLRFRVRGDGKTYQVMLMAAGNQRPSMVPFVAGPEWQEVSVPLKDFAGIDPTAIAMLAFSAGPQPGDYRFELADVRLLEQ